MVMAWPGTPHHATSMAALAFSPGDAQAMGKTSLNRFDDHGNALTAANAQ